MAKLILFAILVSISMLQCHASTLRFKPFQVINQKMDEVDEFLNLFFGPKRGTMLSNAAIKTCGGDAVIIGNYSVTPDPLQLPGTITLLIKAELKENIAASDNVEVTQDWKFKPQSSADWIDFPCVDNLGSCSYPNVCDIINFDPCPDVLEEYHFSCSCPFKKGQYNLVPALSIDVNAAALIPAKYDIQANFTRAKQLLTCLHLSFEVA